MPFADATVNLLAKHSLAVAGLVLIAIPLAYASKRASVHWRYWIAVVLLVKCLAFPVFEVPWISSKLAAFDAFQLSVPIPGFDAKTKDGNAGNFSGAPNAPEGIGGQRESRNSNPRFSLFRQAVFWIAVWVTGVMVYSGWLMLHALKVQRFLRNNRSEPNLEVELEFSNLLQGLPLGFRPRLQMIEGIPQPFVWGAWTGTIYLPRTFGSIGGRTHRKLILAHELGHVIRRDAGVNLIQMVAQALFWFHPAVWWLNAFIRREREKCSDEFAVSITRSSVKDYAAAVVDHLVQSGAPCRAWSSLAVSGNAQSLESRVLSILDPRRKIRPSVKWSGALCAGMAAVLIVPIQVGRPAPARNALKPRVFQTIKFSPTKEDRTGSFHRLDEVLPRGRLEFESVPFEFNGAVRSSRSSTPDGLTAGTILKLNRPFNQLHFAHGVEGTAGEADVIAEIRVRYQDGKVVRIPIQYGVHALSFEFWDYAPVRDPASKMVWVGHDAASKINHSALRIYHTPWRNPHSDRVVESVSYLTAQSECDPFLAAMTVEWGGVSIGSIEAQKNQATTARILD